MTALSNEPPAPAHSSQMISRIFSASDLRAAAPVYLEDVNDRGIVMLVTRHSDQSQSSRYFYPWSVIGWLRLAEEDERDST